MPEGQPAEARHWRTTVGQAADGTVRTAEGTQRGQGWALFESHCTPRHHGRKVFTSVHPETQQKKDILNAEHTQSLSDAVSHD